MFGIDCSGAIKIRLLQEKMASNANSLPRDLPGWCRFSKTANQRRQFINKLPSRGTKRDVEEVPLLVHHMLVRITDCFCKVLTRALGAGRNIRGR